MQLKEAILNRRSIRSFTEYYVSDHEIREMLEAARWAPSWANTQVWCFVVVRDRNMIKEITDAYSKTNPSRFCSMNASAIIVACAKKGISGCRDGKESTILPNWYMFDLGLAIENLCLRAHELGLGTVIVGLMDHHILKQILKVPDDYEAVAAIPVGQSAEPEREGPKRKTIASMTFLNRFGEPYIRGDQLEDY